MGFNLDDYEPVEDRIKKFYSDHEDGRIITKVVYQDSDRVIIKAFIYKNEQDVIWATGLAQEFRDTELRKNQYGKEYETVNYSSNLENCETSAIGRALANANYAGSKRPSREEMEKVERMSPTAVATDKQLLTIKRLFSQLGVDKETRDPVMEKVKTKSQASDLIVQLMAKVEDKKTENN